MEPGSSPVTVACADFGCVLYICRVGLERLDRYDQGTHRCAGWQSQPGPGCKDRGLPTPREKKAPDYTGANRVT